MSDNRAFSLEHSNIEHGTERNEAGFVICRGVKQQCHRANKKIVIKNNSGS